MLLPHIEADDADDVSEDLLERCTLPIVLIRAVKCALDNDGIKVGEDFIFL